MNQIAQFVSIAQTGRFSIIELCKEFGISRKTGHKYLRRFREENSLELKPKSRRPHHLTSVTSESVEQLILSERKLHPTWGAKKIRVILLNPHPGG